MSKSSYNFPSGVHTVLVTPFNDDANNSVNFDDIKKWIGVQADSDVTGLVLLGTTSESPTLSFEEKLQIVRFVSELNKCLTRPKFITVGVGGNDTRETLEFARACVGYCDAFMVTVPHYNKPPQRGIVEHFKTVCNHPELQHIPIIFYNVPSRTGLNAEPETIKTVFNECNNMVAIKEASGSVDQLIKLRSLVPNLKIFSGDDKLVLDVMLHGGVGVISVASNVIPEILAEVVNKCLSYDYKSAVRIFYQMNLPTFIDTLFCETNPIPIKFLMKELEIYQSDQMRLPLVKLADNKKESVLLAYNSVAITTKIFN